MRVLNLVMMLIMVTLAMPTIASERERNGHKSHDKHDRYKWHESESKHGKTKHNSTEHLQTSSKSIFVATSGEVVLTFLSKTAAYSNDLFLEGSPESILNNQTAQSGQQFSLGSFQAGTELVFKIFVNDIGRTFFNGIATNNPDNVLHAAYSARFGKPLIVGFEDLYGGGDRDFDDLVFSLSNVVIGETPVAAVPESETYAMLLAGLFTIGALKRRKSAR
jgi:hypothetical protein